MEPVWLLLSTTLGKFLSLGVLFGVTRSAIVAALSLPPDGHRAKLFEDARSDFSNHRRHIKKFARASCVVLVVGLIIYLSIDSFFPAGKLRSGEISFCFWADVAVIVLVLGYFAAIFVEFGIAVQRTKLGYLMSERRK